MFGGSYVAGKQIAGMGNPLEAIKNAVKTKASRIGFYRRSA